MLFVLQWNRNLKNQHTNKKRVKKKKGRPVGRPTHYVTQNESRIPDGLVVFWLGYSNISNAMSLTLRLNQ